MAFTGQLSTANSRLGNIVPALGATFPIPAFPTTTPAVLKVEIAWPNDPVNPVGYYLVALNDGPSAYWRLDNVTANLDQTGGGNTLTMTGSPTLISSLLTGDTDQATSFDGTNDAGEAANSAALSPTGPMALTGFFQFAALPGATKVFAGKKGSYELRIRSDGKVEFAVKKGATLTTLVSASALSTGVTYRLAGVYDGTNLRIYIDGGASNANTAYSAGIDATGSPFLIGRTDNSSASPTYNNNNIQGGAGSSISIRVPGTANVGDYLLCFFIAKANLSITPPAGYVLLGKSPAQAATQAYCYGKFCETGDPNNFHTWNFSESSSYNRGTIAAFPGVSAVSPVGSVSANSQASGATLASTLLPVYDNTLIVGYFANNTNGGSWTETLGTERLDSNGEAFTTIPVGASSSQSVSGTTTNTTFESHTIAVELVGVLTSTYQAVKADEVSVWGFAPTQTQLQTQFDAADDAPPALVWTDITADVRKVTTKRGRQYERNKMDAGTATVLLKDDARKYDPANTLSPYYPNVIPLRQIRITATVNSVTYQIFQGYIERWPSQWPPEYGQRYAQVQLTAVDGFEPLALTGVSGTIPASQSGTTIGSLLGRANWPGDQRELDPGAFSLAAITLDSGTGILNYIQDIADSEDGVFFINGQGFAVFHDKNHRSTNPLSTTVQATFSDIPDGNLPYIDLQPSFDKDQIVNDWTVVDSASGAHNAFDQTSINKYFRRSGSRSTYLAAGDATVMASHLLSRTKDPGYRFETLTLVPDRNLTLWEQALGREISDRVRVKRQPVGIVPGTQLVRDCWIEQISWDITPGQPWRVSWQLSPAS